MTSLPVGANHEKPTSPASTRSGDAGVIRGVAAALVLLALVALLVIERPAAYVVAGSTVAVAGAFFAAARWRRADA